MPHRNYFLAKMEPNSKKHKLDCKVIRDGMKIFGAAAFKNQNKWEEHFAFLQHTWCLNFGLNFDVKISSKFPANNLNQNFLPFYHSPLFALSLSLSFLMHDLIMSWSWPFSVSLSLPILISLSHTQKTLWIFYSFSIYPSLYLSLTHTHTPSLFCTLSYTHYLCLSSTISLSHVLFST